MRLVADGEMKPVEAVRAYHAALKDRCIPAIRTLEDDNAHRGGAEGSGIRLRRWSSCGPGPSAGSPQIIGDGVK